MRTCPQSSFRIATVSLELQDAVVRDALREEMPNPDPLGRGWSACSREHGGGAEDHREHSQDWKTTLDSSEQTESYADRRRSDLEFQGRERVLLKVSPRKEVIRFRCERQELGLCRKTGCCTRKEDEEATEP